MFLPKQCCKNPKSKTFPQAKTIGLKKMAGGRHNDSRKKSMLNTTQTGPAVDVKKPKVLICQKCGDHGFEEALIFCCKCKVNTEHYYCLDVIPKPFNLNVKWTCHDCDSRLPEQTTLYKCTSVKNNQISLCTMLAGLKELNNSISIEVETELPSYDSNNSSQLSNSHVEFKVENHYNSFLNETVKDASSDCEHSHSNSRPGKRRKLVHEDAGEADKAAGELRSARVESFGTTGVIPATDRTTNTLFSNAQHIDDSVWSGSFSVDVETFRKLDGVTAYLSSKAIFTVDQAKLFMPKKKMLRLEMFPRLDVWPKSFLQTSPAEDNVSFYFFPEMNSDREKFAFLLEKMLKHDLALKTVFDCTELLIFTSLELPVEFWRYQGQHYLWGFVQKHEPPVSAVEPLSVHVTAQNDVSHEITVERNVPRNVLDERELEMRKPVDQNISSTKKDKIVADPPADNRSFNQDPHLIGRGNAVEVHLSTNEQPELVDETDEEYMEGDNSSPSKSSELREETDEEYIPEGGEDNSIASDPSDQSDEDYMDEDHDRVKPVTGKQVNEDLSLKKKCKTVTDPPEHSAEVYQESLQVGKRSSEVIVPQDKVKLKRKPVNKNKSLEKQCELMTSLPDNLNKSHQESLSVGKINSEKTNLGSQEQPNRIDKTDDECTDVDVLADKDVDKDSVSTKRNRRKPDIGWEHAIKIEGKRLALVCIYCTCLMTGRGRITRLKEHLAGGYDKKTIKSCPKVPLEVREVMKKICEEKEREKLEVEMRVKENQRKRSVMKKRGLDSAWKYAIRIKGTVHGMTCKFCLQNMRGGGITRFKAHLARLCSGVSPDVQEAMAKELLEKGKEKAVVEERVQEIKKKLKKESKS